MGLFPKNLNEFIALAGVPRGPLSQVYIVDPVNGNDNNPGTNWRAPLLTLEEAYAKTVSGQNDTVVIVGGATALSPAAAIVWANSYTHLIGLSADIGMGQRCRIVNTAANDLAVLFTLSGSGCIIQNVQFFDGKDKAEDGACLLVSGSRNRFENVFVAGMGDATAGAPFSRAGSYSLKVTGAENTFKNCVIGLDTVARTAANSELIVAGARNRFEGCDIRCNSTTAGKFLVTIDNSAGDLRDTQFTNCLFFNYTTNWAAGIDNAISVAAAGNTQWTILKNCQLVGATGWASNVGHVYSADAQPNAGFGISLNPTT
jgi:hypothetical protein